MKKYQLLFFALIVVYGCNFLNARERGYEAGMKTIQTREAQSINNTTTPESVALLQITPQETKTPRNGWICFVNDRDIWLMRVDGSELQRITETEEIWEDYCALSWDGRMLLYTDSDGGLYLINRDRTSQETLLGRDAARYPSWSPDGEKIIYIGKDLLSIYLLDIGTKTSTKIYQSERGAIFSAVMSPDGNKILFSSSGVSTLDLNGSNPTQVLEPLSGLMISALAWSKDGDKIAFHTMNGVPIAESWVEFSDIYTMNKDGTELVNLTNNAPDKSFTAQEGKNVLRISLYPHWINHDQIVFCFNEDSGGYDCKPYIMNSDGSSAELLVDRQMQQMDYVAESP